MSAERPSVNAPCSDSFCACKDYPGDLTKKNIMNESALQAGGGGCSGGKVSSCMVVTAGELRTRNLVTDQLML